MSFFRLHHLFPVKDQLSEAEVRTGLQYVVRDGMASQAMASLTGSAFLVALALHLGASNTLIGVLAALPQLSQLIQIPAIHLVRKMRNRRLVTVLASLTGRLFWLFIAVAPFVFSDTATLGVLLVGLLMASIMAGVANCGWNSWLHELVPQDELGSFFGRRFSMATATGVVVSLVAAYFLDHLAPTLFADVRHGYSAVFCLGFLCGVLGVAFIARIPEPRMQPATEPLLMLIARPFRDANFKNLLVFLSAWHFTLYLATPFFSVYMLKRLEMDLSWVVGLIVLGRLVNIVFLRLWGSFADSISNKSVLGVSLPLCLICILGWTFTTLPDKHEFTLPLLVLLHICMGIAMAGITLATGNISLKLAPAGEGVNYLAVSNFVIAIAAGIAPLLGGPIVDFFVDRQLSWTLNWISPDGVFSLETINLQQWDFLFLMSFLLGLYALHRLTMIREVGEVSERMVLVELVSAFGRELREFSTVASIRNVISVAGVTRLRKASDAEGTVEEQISEGT